jgi:2-oxoisovalerate dehydrogenase E1 component
MWTAREIDRIELGLVRQGQAFFHVSGAGHEGLSALAAHLNLSDWLHLHYRDKALMLARGIPVKEFFLSLLCKEGSHSAGRQMSAHLSNRALNLLSLVGPVGNSALQAVGVAAAIRDKLERPIVVCCVGEGTTQEGEFLEAVAEAVRQILPVLFIVEDNGYSISTLTRGRTCFDLPDGPLQSFYGLPIHRLDGKDALAADVAFGAIVSRMRHERKPAFVIFQVERLCDHTHADDQAQYRDPHEIAKVLANADPIRVLETQMLAQGVDIRTIRAVQECICDEVEASAASALSAQDPQPVFDAKAPLPESVRTGIEYIGSDIGPQLNMREAINKVLRHWLDSDPRVTLYGEDIEDPKGDVFGITRGLSSEFRGRVLNSPLSESTIVGTCIGRALAGQRPVAFIQFADFLPLAFNQILSELGSMYWRTNGGWHCPVIVMIACGGYRPGLGPFHAQTLESLAIHTPGLDVVMPSSAGDVAGLLNAVFRSGRPTLFFYPKSCLNLADRSTSTDVEQQFVPLGSARRIHEGQDLTLVTWGSPRKQCLQAAEILAETNYTVDLFDLRSLSPWDEAAVIASAEKTSRLIVVHEDNRSCGFGAEVVATVNEKARRPVQIRRVTRTDTYVPCHFASQLAVLPSLEGILTAAAELLDLELTWQRPRAKEAGYLILAQGSGPADESVEIIDLKVGIGNHVLAGQVVAEVEATKALFEIEATCDGIVVEVFVQPGDTVRVGQPLLSLCSNAPRISNPVTEENPGCPTLRPRHVPSTHDPSRNHPILDFSRSTASQLGLIDVVGVTGSRCVTNRELLGFFPNRSDDILERTGIETRPWVIEGETLLSLASEAARRLLDRHKLRLSNLAQVISCTTTPDRITPSLACRICAHLGDGSGSTIAAYDLNAACSAYLFALRQAHDFLLTHPQGQVLVVTAEVLSPLLAQNDFSTLPIFADAATATLVVGAQRLEEARMHFYPPALSGRCEDGRCLSVPLSGQGSIKMMGPAVAAEALRSMSRILERACEDAATPLSRIDLVIPHQANQRILNAVARRIGRPVFSNIRHLGNTSSCTIPLALQELLTTAKQRQTMALVAFGGGFTCGATIGEIVP